MTGNINIKITEEAIEVNANLDDRTTCGDVAIVDALMGALQITGIERCMICDTLIVVDRRRAYEAAESTKATRVRRPFKLRKKSKEVK